MGSGQSYSVPNVSQPLIASSDDLNQETPSIEPEIPPMTSAQTENNPLSDIMETLHDDSNAPHNDVSVTLDALNLSQESVPEPTSAGLDEIQSPPFDPAIVTHHPLVERPLGMNRNETHGTVIMDDVDVDDGNHFLLDPGMDNVSSSGVTPNLGTETDVDDNLIISTKPDIGSNPSSETVFDRPHAIADSDGVSPVSSSSVSLNMMKVNTSAPHETVFNTEDNFTTTRLKSVLPDIPIVNSENNLNAAVDINARLDTRVEVRVYPCSNSAGNGANKKFTQFTIKPEVCRIFNFTIFSII